MEWAHRLGAATQGGLTPYERSTLLSEALPLGAPFIQRITDIYVHYRFAPRSAHGGGENDRQAELAAEWQQLRPVLWRAWFAKRFLRKDEPRKRR